MPDRLIAHATRKQQLAEVGLDTAGIAASIRAAAETKPHVEVSVRSVRDRKTLAGKDV
jgi:hypothetical protein